MNKVKKLIKSREEIPYEIAIFLKKEKIAKLLEEGWTEDLNEQAESGSIRPPASGLQILNLEEDPYLLIDKIFLPSQFEKETLVNAMENLQVFSPIPSEIAKFLKEKTLKHWQEKCGYVFEGDLFRPALRSQVKSEGRNKVIG